MYIEAGWYYADLFFLNEFFFHTYYAVQVRIYRCKICKLWNQNFDDLCTKISEVKKIIVVCFHFCMYNFKQIIYKDSFDLNKWKRYFPLKLTAYSTDSSCVSEVERHWHGEGTVRSRRVHREQMAGKIAGPRKGCVLFDDRHARVWKWGGGGHYCRHWSYEMSLETKPFHIRRLNG